MPDDSVLCGEGVGAVVLVGELAPLKAEPLMEFPWLLDSAIVFEVASRPTQKSQRIHPRTVPALPQLTTETGDTRR